MATPEQFKSLKYFKITEFKHPELMDMAFLLFLEDVRAIYGSSIKLNSDGRTVEQNAVASGSGTRSTHLLGRAVDIDTTYKDYKQHTQLMTACLKAAVKWNVVRSLGIELVDEEGDSHLHLDLGGTFPDGYQVARPLIWRSKD